MTGLGIGKDVWTVPFDNLTEALKVRSDLRHCRDNAYRLVGLLLRRTPVSVSTADYQDRHPLHLPPHLPNQAVSDTRLRRYWIERGLRNYVLPHHNISV